MNDIDSLDDVDQCIIYYNQAVVYYHTRKYGQALTITEKLYTFLEPLGMSTSTNEILVRNLVEVMSCLL